MGIRSWGWAGLVVVATFALWLLLGSGRVFGVDIGGLGVTLVVLVAWGSLYAVSRTPAGGDIEHAVSPGEWKAWIGLGFMLVGTAYLLGRIELMDGESMARASAVARNLIMLLVAWIVLSKVLAARWKDRVQEDERDREIEVRAAGGGRGALGCAVIGLAVLLGFSPVDRLQWATHFMIGNLLVLALMASWLVEYAATAGMYWWDRR